MESGQIRTMKENKDIDIDVVKKKSSIFTKHHLQKSARKKKNDDSTAIIQWELRTLDAPASIPCFVAGTT
jgi:hypothetical protein